MAPPPSTATAGTVRGLIAGSAALLLEDDGEPPAKRVAHEAKGAPSVPDVAMTDVAVPDKHVAKEHQPRYAGSAVPVDCDTSPQATQMETSNHHGQ